MRAATERLVATALAVACLAGPAATSARAQEGDAVAQPAGVPERARRPLRAEAQGGVNAALGTGGVAVVYAPLPWLSLGAGMGLVKLSTGGTHPRYELFARAHLVRRAWFALGPVLAVSMGDREREETYERPQFAPDHLRWAWTPGYRVDAGLGGEVTLGKWTARLDAGVGYVLNRPTCTYSTDVTSFSGSCSAPEIPAYYHFSREPGRIVPTVTLSIGPEVSWPDALTQQGPPDGDPAVARRTDARAGAAWAAPTALTHPRGTVTATLYELSLLNVTVGIVDRVEATGGLGVAFFDRGSFLWDFSVKTAVARGGRLRLALMAGGAGIKTSGSGLSAFGVGPVGSVCLDEACASMISASVLAGGVHADFGDNGPSTAAGVVVSPSAVVALAPHLKLVGEVHLLSRASSVWVWVVALRVPYGPLAIEAGAADLGDYRSKAPIGSVSWRW